MEDTISGGCGVPFHVQRYRCNDRTIYCEDCRRQVPTAGLGYYFCKECEKSLCTRCTLDKQGHQGSSDAGPSSRANPFDPDTDSDEDEEEEEEEPVLRCAGSLTHSLELLKESPYYNNRFRCNMCKDGGAGEVYHCESCQFDAHPQCAEVEEKVKVFYHQHPLQSSYMGVDEDDIMCQFCFGDVLEEDVSPWVYRCSYCPGFAVHARCAKYAKSLIHKSHPGHKLKLVHRYLPCICDGCGNEIAHNYHYTCTKRGCDFDLHPLCAVRPSKPLCIKDPSHRVDIDYFPEAYELCDLCETPSDDVWVYRCNVCDVSMHVDCFSFDSDDDEEDGNFGELCEQFKESMDEFDNRGNREKLDRLSELVNSRFMSSRQNSANSRGQREVSSHTRSETHILDQGFSNIRIGDDSPPRYQRDRSSSPPYFSDDSPPFSPRESDAAEAERRNIKQAAKEQKRNEKAVRREEKAKYQQKVIAQLKDLNNSKQFGRSQADIMIQLLDELKVDTGNMQRSDAKRHQEHMKHLHEQTKVQGERHREYLNKLQEITRTQVHSTTRAVPRLVLCIETSSMRKKLLTSIRVGIKGVQLHLMCEYEEQPHVVAGAPGCEINQRVAGDRWTKIQPFLAAGLKVVELALTLSGSSLKDVLPDFYTMVTETQPIDLIGNHAVQTGRSQEAVEEEAAAAQWLVSYLKAQQVDIAESFGLSRIRYKAPQSIKGTIGWLCDNHREMGRKDGSLEHFPHY